MRSILIAILVLLSTAAGLTSCQSSETEFRWNSLKNASIKNWKIKSPQSETNNIMSVKFEAGPLLVSFRAQKTSEVLARSQLKNIKLATLSFFRDHTSPYPDVISNNVHCSKDFAPKEAELDSSENYRWRVKQFANSRFSIGLCDPSQATYHAVRLLIYCKKSQIFYEAELFEAVDPKKESSIESISDAFICN